MKTIVKKSIGIFSIFITVGLLLNACMPPVPRCIRGNGVLTSETRIPDEEFIGIVSEGEFNVFITQDTIDEIVVEAEENLIPYIYTRVDGNDLVLKVRENRCIRSNEAVHIYIRTNDLRELTLSGSGNIEFDSLTTNKTEIDLLGSGDIEGEIYTDFLEADISGSGNITLSGQTDESDLLITGSGNFHASDLMQNTCFAKITGSGNMYLSVSDLLDVVITGSGNINYSGTPAVNLSVTGSGNVYHN